MTITETFEPQTETPTPPNLPDADSALAAAQDVDVEAAPASVGVICAATLLSVAAAGWMAAGVFSGVTPKLIGLFGAVLGVGMLGLSFRTRNPALWQWLTLPAILAAGALLLIGDVTGGTATLPGLIGEALRGGGLAQAPVPFDPGWKFLLLIITAGLGTGAAAVALARDNPRLAVYIPAPVAFGALFIQPPDGGMVVTLIGLLLLVSSMAVAYGADLAKEGATSGRFEARRFVRGAGVMALLVVILVVVNQIGFLFPEVKDDQVIPPKRPEVPPPEPDRELFTVTSERQVPWRLGVLDVYDGLAWLTPPYDPKRFVKVESGGIRVASPAKIPGAPVTRPSGASAAGGKPMEVTFKVSDIKGRGLPAVANPRGVETGASIEYDPRTQTLRVETRARAGTSYTIEAPVPPSGADLAKAGAPPRSMREFLEVPPPPPEVADLLAQAPPNPFDRLQFLRNAYYSQVVAAGAGNPVDVPPGRVAEMLGGKEATPFEITAGEALIARWAGIPSRLGYGYYGGDRVGDDPLTLSIRPKHGSSWLEVYFEGYGWVPIVGTPPRAKSSLSNDSKKDDPTVRPTDELALVVYLPIRLQGVQQLFTIVRYWVARAFPWVVGVGLVLWLYPGVVKIARRLRRRRWAMSVGARARLASAYCEFRDAASDFNVGYHALTPLRFLEMTAEDPEHEELAWLVTRGLWGDLARDLQVEDVAAAEALSASLRSRLRRAQSPLYRAVAFSSRASLRDPYTNEVPNLWVELNLRKRLKARLRGLKKIRLPRLPQRRSVPSTAAVVLLLAMLLGGCAPQLDLSARPDDVLPPRIVPEQLGRVRFTRAPEAEKVFATGGEDALVGDGLVYTLEADDEIEGSLQVAAFKPALRQRHRDVKAGVLQSIGSGRFKLQKIAGQKVYELTMPEQRLLLWFPENVAYYELLVTRSSFQEAGRLFTEILAYQRGEKLPPPIPPPPDRRRGADR